MLQQCLFSSAAGTVPRSTTSDHSEMHCQPIQVGVFSCTPVVCHHSAETTMQQHRRLKTQEFQSLY